jgi:cell division transport system permease protein
VDLGTERPQVPAQRAQHVADRAAGVDLRPRAGRRRRHHDVPRFHHHRHRAARQRIGRRMAVEVASEITMQVRPQAGRDLERDVTAAAEAMRTQPGIVQVKPFSKDESARLLEPWLGSGLSIEQLPVPRASSSRACSPAPRSTSQACAGR